MALPATPAFSKKLKIKIRENRKKIIPRIYFFISSGKANRLGFFSLSIVFFLLFFLITFHFSKIYFPKPVPAGISFPIITFSFNPFNLSSLPSIEARIKTLEVSWKEAADKKESVVRATFEIPKII